MRQKHNSYFNDNKRMNTLYRVTHLLANLGWADFDLDVPPSCPAAHPLLPNSHQPEQNQADSGTVKIQVNPTQVLGQTNYPVE